MLISVPLLALTGVWQVAGVFIICERMGKALRSPAKDTILSQATSSVGRGFGFGLHETMDQIGAIVGPLVFTVVFSINGDCRTGYSLLWIPFVLVMLFLVIARIRVPQPGELEEHADHLHADDGFSRLFWLYTIFSALAITGFANFSVISYHLKTAGVLNDSQIPIFYSIAMGNDAAAAMLVGKFYGRKGLNTLLMVPLLTIPIPALAFTTEAALVAGGMLLWGVVMAIHETIMRAAIADITSIKKRETGYGIFNTAYGLFMFVGSSTMGILYEFNVIYIVLFCAVMEILAMVVFYLLKKEVAVKGYK